MIVIALLVLIVLILLFGRAAVKGWLRGAALWIVGLVFLAIVVSLFREGGPLDLGPNGLAYLILGIAGLMVIAGGLAAVLPDKPMSAVPPNNRKRPKIDRLWFHYSKDIARFDLDARATALRYYNAKNVQGLRQFCEEEIARLK